MKNLTKRMYKGVPTLFIGNNRKPIGYDNYYAKQFALEGEVNAEISLIFYDIDNAVTLLGISDKNDVSEWNLALNYGDYGGFIDKDYNPIAFESCIVDGNKLTLIPSDYSVIQGLQLYEYDSLNEYIFQDAILKGLTFYGIYVEGEEFARNINDDVADSVGGHDDYNDVDFDFSLDSYGYTETLFNSDNLTNVTNLTINDAENLITVNAENMPHLKYLRVSGCQVLEEITVVDSPIINLLLYNLPLSAFTLDCPTLDIINIDSCTNLDILNLETPLLTNLSVNSSLLSEINDNEFLNLTSISMSNNLTTTFDNNNFPLVGQIYINNTPISAFTNNICPEIDVLFITNGMLTDFYGNDLTAVRELYLNSNQLTTFNANEFNNLELLNLQSNMVASFKDNILPSLINLDIENNGLTAFTGNVLTSLNVLYLHDNNLVAFEVDSTVLVNLTLQNNQLTTFNSPLNSVLYLTINNNNLDQTSIDYILAQLVLHGGINGTAFMHGGGNPAPSAQGVIDRTTLLNRGWNVATT